MSSPSNPIRTLLDGIERMSQRERRMVAALGVTFIGCIFLICGYLIYSGLSELEDRNQAMRQAIWDIEQKRSAYVRAKAKLEALELRIGTTPLMLPGFVEQAAKESNIEIRESSPKPPEPIGKKYLQQAVVLRLSKVPLDGLLTFLRKIETNPTNLVMVTELSIRTRDDKHVEFDVDMTVATYEKATAKPKPKPEEGASAASDKEPS